MANLMLTLFEPSPLTLHAVCACVGVCVFLGQGDKGSVSRHSTVVILHGHEDVAVVAPVGGPGVLHQPVGLPLQDAVAHRQHGVVQVLRLVT